MTEAQARQKPHKFPNDIFHRMSTVPFRYEINPASLVVKITIDYGSTPVGWSNIPLSSIRDFVYNQNYSVEYSNRLFEYLDETWLLKKVWKYQTQSIRQLLVPSVFLRKTAGCIFVYSLLKHISLIEGFEPDWSRLWALVAKGFHFDPLSDKLDAIMDIMTETFVFTCVRKTLESQMATIVDKVDSLSLTAVIQLNTIEARLVTTVDEWLHLVDTYSGSMAGPEITSYNVRQVSDLVDRIKIICVNDRRGSNTRQETSWGTGLSIDARKECERLIKAFFKSQNMSKAVASGGIVTSLKDHASVVAYIQFLILSDAVTPEDRLVLTEKRDDIIKSLGVNTIYPLILMKEQFKSALQDFNTILEGDALKSVEFFSQLIEGSATYSEMWRSLLNIKGICMEFIFCKSHGLRYLAEHRKPNIQSIVEYYFNDKLKDFMDSSMSQTRLREHCPDVFLVIKDDKRAPSVRFSESSRQVSPDGGVEIVMTKAQSGSRVTKSSDMVDASTAESFVQSRRECSLFIQKLDQQLSRSTGTDYSMSQKTLKRDTVLVLIELGYQTNSKDKAESDQRILRGISTLLGYIGIKVLTIAMSVSSEHLQQAQWLDGQLAGRMKKFLSPLFAKLTSSIPPDLKMMNFSSITNQSIRRSMTSQERKLSFIQDFDVIDQYVKSREELCSLQNDSMLPVKLQKDLESTLVLGSTISTRDATKVHNFLLANAAGIVSLVQNRDGDCPEIVDNDCYISFIIGSMKEELEAISKQTLCRELSAAASSLKDSYRKFSRHTKSEHTKKEILSAIELYETTKSAHEQHRAQDCRIVDSHIVKGGWIHDVLCAINRCIDESNGDLYSIQYSTVNAPLHEGRFYDKVVTRSEIFNQNQADDVEEDSSNYEGFSGDEDGEYEDVHDNSIVQQCKMHLSKFTSLILPGRTAKQKKARQPLMAVKQLISAYSGGLLVDSTGLIQVPLPALLRMAGMPDENTTNPASIADQSFDQEAKVGVKGSSKPKGPFVTGRSTKFSAAYKNIVNKLDKSLTLKGSLTRDAYNNIKTVKKVLSLGSSYFHCDTMGEFLDIVAPDNVIRSSELTTSIGLLLSKGESGDPVHNYFNSKAERKARLADSKAFDNRFPLHNIDEIADYLELSADLIRIDLTPSEETMFIEQMFVELTNRYGENTVNSEIAQTMRRFCRLFMSTGVGQTLLVYSYLCMTFLMHTSEFLKPGVKVSRLPCMRLNLLTKVNRNRHENHLTMLLDESFIPVTKPFFLRRDRATLGQGACYTTALFMFQSLQCTGSSGFLFEMRLSDIVAECGAYLESSKRNLLEILHNACVSGVCSVLKEAEKLVDGARDSEAEFEGGPRYGIQRFCYMVANFALIILPSMLCNSKNVSALFQMLRFPLNLCVSDVGFPFGIGGKLDCPHRKIPHLISKLYCRLISCLVIRSHDKTMALWSEDKPDPARYVASVMCFPSCCMTERQLQSDMYICHFFHKVLSDFAGERIKAFADFCEKVHDWDEDLTNTLIKIRKAEKKIATGGDTTHIAKLKERLEDLRIHSRLLLCVKERSKKRPMISRDPKGIVGKQITTADEHRRTVVPPQLQEQHIGSFKEKHIASSSETSTSSSSSGKSFKEAPLHKGVTFKEAISIDMDPMERISDWVSTAATSPLGPLPVSRKVSETAVDITKRRLRGIMLDYSMSAAEKRRRESEASGGEGSDDDEWYTSQGYMPDRSSNHDSDSSDDDYVGGGSKGSYGSSTNGSELSRGSTYTVSSTDEDLPFTRHTTSINEPINQGVLWRSIKTCIRHDPNHSFCVPEVLQACAEYSKSGFSSLNIHKALTTKYMHEQSSSATETTSIIKEIVEKLTPTQACSIVRRATVLKCTKYFNLYRSIDLEGQKKTKGLEESLLNLIDNFTIRLDDDVEELNVEIEERVREVKDFIGQMKKKRFTTWQDVCKQPFENIFDSESSFLIMAFMKSLHKEAKSLMKNFKGTQDDEVQADGYMNKAGDRPRHSDSKQQPKKDSLWSMCKSFMEACTERGGILSLSNRIFIENNGVEVAKMCNQVRGEVYTKILNLSTQKKQNFQEDFAKMSELFDKLQDCFDDLQESKRANPIISYPDKTHKVSTLENELFDRFSEELSTCCLIVLAAGSISPYVCSDKTSSSPIIHDAVQLIKKELESLDGSESEDITAAYSVKGLLPSLFTYFSIDESVSQYLTESFGPSLAGYSNLIKYCILIILNIKRPYSNRKDSDDINFPKPMTAQEGVERLMAVSSVDRLDLDLLLWCASLVLGNESICRRLLNRMEKGIRLPRSLRSKVIFEMINMIQKTDSTNLMDMGSYFLQDQNNPIYAGISPKAQIGATRDLFVLYCGSKLQIRTTESLSRALMSTCTTRDALTDKRAKDRFLTYAKTMMQMSQEQNGIQVGDSSKVFHATWNIVGDCTKWGPIHSSASFSVYMQQLLSTTPDWSPHVRLLMLKFLTKHVEVPPEAIVKIINSFFDDPEFVRAKNNLSGVNMDKELGRLMKKHVKRIWNNNKCATSIVDWSLSKSRNYIKAYNHMGQGIHHATSSLLQSGCSYLIDDIVTSYVERRMPGIICTIVHTGSSDDFSKCITMTGTIPTAKHTQFSDLLPSIKRDCLCLYMALMRCCQMKVSVKTSLSPILAEFYSDFLYLNRRSVSTSKAIIGQVIANAAYSPLTLYQSIHIECQQCLYWGVPLSTILLFSLCKQMVFIMNSISFFKKYGAFLFRTLPSTCRLYIPSFSTLLDSGVVVEELSIINNTLDVVIERSEAANSPADQANSETTSATGTEGNFVRVSSGTSGALSINDVSLSVASEEDISEYDQSDIEGASDEDARSQDSSEQADDLVEDEDTDNEVYSEDSNSHDRELPVDPEEHMRKIVRSTVNIIDDLPLDIKVILIMLCYYSGGENMTPVGRTMLQRKKTEVSTLADPFCILVPESVLEKRSQVRGAKEQVDGERLLSALASNKLDEIALGLIAKSAITENTKVELSRVRQALDSPTIIYGLSNGINDLSVSIIRQQLRGYFFTNKTDFTLDDHWVKSDKNTMITGNFENVKPKVRVRVESFLKLVERIAIRIVTSEDMPEISIAGLIKMRRQGRETQGQPPELILNVNNMANAKEKVVNLLAMCSTNTAKNMRVLEDQNSYGSIELNHTKSEKNFLYYSESEVGIHNNPAVVMASFISKKALIESKPQGLDVNTLDTDGQVFYRIYPDIYNYLAEIVVNVGGHATREGVSDSHEINAVSHTHSGEEHNYEANSSGETTSAAPSSEPKVDIKDTVRTLVSLSRMISGTKSERVSLITVMEINESEEVVPEVILPTYMSFEGRKFNVTPDKLRVSLDNYVYIFKGVISCINWSGFDTSTKNSLLYRFLLSSPKDMITKLLTYTHLGSVNKCGFLDTLKQMQGEIPPGTVESLLLIQSRMASGKAAAEEYRILGQIATNPTAIIKEHAGKGELTHSDIRGDTKKGFVTLNCGAGSAIVQYSEDVATIMLSRESDQLLTELMMILGRMSGVQYSNKSSFESKKEFLDTLPLVESQMATTSLGRKWFRLLTIGRDGVFRFRRYTPSAEERLSSDARAVFVTDSVLVPKYVTVERSVPALTLKWLRTKLQVVIVQPAIVSEVPLSIDTLRSTTQKLFSTSTEEEIFNYFNREERQELVRSVNLRSNVSIQSIALYHLLLVHPIVGPLSQTDRQICMPVPLDKNMSWTRNTEDRNKEIEDWRLERWRQNFFEKNRRLPNQEEQEKFIAQQADRTPIGRSSTRQLRAYTRPYEVDGNKILETQEVIRKLQTIFTQLNNLSNYPAISLLLDYFGLADMEVEFKSGNIWKTNITGNWICKTADATRVNTLIRVVQSALSLSNKAYNEVFIPLAIECNFLESTNDISSILVRSRQLIGQQTSLFFMSVYIASIYIRSRCMTVPDAVLMKTAGFVKVVTELNPFSTLKLTSDLILTFSLKNNRVRMIIEILGVQPELDIRDQIFKKMSQVLGLTDLINEAIQLFKTHKGQERPILSENEGTVVADLDLQLCASRLPLLSAWTGIIQRSSSTSGKLDGWALLFYHLNKLSIDSATSKSHEPEAGRLFNNGKSIYEDLHLQSTSARHSKKTVSRSEAASEKLSEELKRLNYGEILIDEGKGGQADDSEGATGGEDRVTSEEYRMLTNPGFLEQFDVE